MFSKLAFTADRNLVLTGLVQKHLFYFCHSLQWYHCLFDYLPFNFCSRILMLTDRSVLTTAAAAAAVHQICVTTIRQICQRACRRWPARSSRCWGWRRTRRERWGLWSARRDMLREEQPVTSLLTLRKEDWWKGKVVAQKAISFKFVYQLNFLK